MFSPPEMIMSFLRSVRYKESLAVEMTDVAAAQPVAEKGRSRLLGVLPVPARDLGAAQADLAAIRMAPSTRPSASRISISTCARARPTEPIFSISRPASIRLSPLQVSVMP